MTKEFVTEAQKYEDALKSTVYWQGAFKPTDFVVDPDSTNPPKFVFPRTQNGHISPSVMRGITLYTVVLKLYDLIVFREGGPEWQKDVLEQPNRGNWVGDNPVRPAVSFLSLFLLLPMQIFEALHDVRGLIERAIQHGSLIDQQLSSSAVSGEDLSVRLANEVTAAESLQKAGMIAQNLANIALSISFFLKVNHFVSCLRFAPLTCALAGSYVLSDCQNSWPESQKPCPQKLDQPPSQSVPHSPALSPVSSGLSSFRPFSRGSNSKSGP